MECLLSYVGRIPTPSESYQLLLKPATPNIVLPVFSRFFALSRPPPLSALELSTESAGSLVSPDLIGEPPPNVLE
jgi:hypothetical protein